MDRKLFLFVLAVALSSALACGVAPQQAAIRYDFYFLCLSDNPLTDEALAGVIEGLAAAGLARDRDYRLVVGNAHGDMPTLTSLADAAANGNYDLVFVSSTPALQAAMRRITRTPVVFTNSANPVEAGVGESLVRHKTNVTGVCSRVDMSPMGRVIRAMMPRAKRIGTLFTPAEVNSVSYRDALEQAATGAGIELVSVPINSAGDIPDAVRALGGRKVDAICQLADNLVGAGMAGVIKGAQDARLPLFAFLAEAETAAVATQVIDFRQCGVDAAGMAMRILGGVSPADIPITPHPRTRMVANRAAAAKFGLAVPTDLDGGVRVR